MVRTDLDQLACAVHRDRVEGPEGPQANEFVRDGLARVHVALRFEAEWCVNCFKSTMLFGRVLHDGDHRLALAGDCGFVIDATEEPEEVVVRLTSGHSQQTSDKSLIHVN
jgi:hypothetical protein